MRRKQTSTAMLISTAALLAAAGAATAAPPVNDTCAARTTVGLGVHVFDPTDATTELASPGCDIGYASADLWYEYTATGNYDVVVQNADCSNHFWLHGVVFSGCGGTEIACQGTMDCSSDKITFRATAGQKYVIRIGTYSEFISGVGAFRITELSPPANDTCGTAQVITTGQHTFDTRYTASDIAGPCDVAGGPYTSRDVWYSYTAQRTGTLHLESTDCGSIGGQIQMTAYNACGGAQVDCEPNLCGSSSTFPVTAGSTYRIRIATYSTHGVATFKIGEVPQNDTCETATPLTIGVHPWSILGAGTQYTPSCHPTSVHDVFYSFTAPSTNFYYFDTSNRGPVLTLYSGCGEPFDSCGYVGSGGTGSRVSRYMESGETVYLRIAEKDYEADFGELSILGATPPANDNCGGATNATLGTTEFSTAGSTFSSYPCGNFEDDRAKDVYFRFVPPASGRYHFDLEGSFFEGYLAFRQTCSTAIYACRADSADIDLRGGVPVYVQVVGNQANFGYGNLNISQVASYTNPTNDTCGTAAVINTNQSIEIPALAIASSDGSSSCSPLANSPDVWFRYTPNFSGYARFDTCNGIGADTTLSVHSGCSGSEIACNDDSCGTKSEVVIPVSSGTAYYVRVGMASLGELTIAQIHGTQTELRVIQVPPPPANDTCATAQPASSGQAYAFDNTYARSEPVSNSQLNLSRDIWYSYTVPAAGEILVALNVPLGSTYSIPGFEIFNGCNGSSVGQFTGLNYGGTITYTYYARFCASAGQQLKFRVGSYSVGTNIGTTGEGVFTMTFTPTTPFIAAPAGAVDENEDCAARVALGTHYAADVINGGWTTGPHFGTITCGVPITATSPILGTYVGFRDVDTFAFDLAQPSTILVMGAAESPIEVIAYNRSNIDYSPVVATNSACVKTFSGTISLPIPEVGSGLGHYLTINLLDHEFTGACGDNENYWLQYFVLNDGSVNITTQPANKNAQLGGSATFTVAASGSNLKYQWRRGNALLTNGGHVAGATSSSLVISNINEADLGSYNVVVSSGCGAVISNNVSLAIGNACPADFNGDNTRDVADLFAYINAWLAKTANADFNGSGSVDVADLFAYINAWLAGC